MTVRVASSMYEERFEPFDEVHPSVKIVEPDLNIVKLNNNLCTTVNNNRRTKEEWLNLMESAAFFKGEDRVLGPLIIMVYEDPDVQKVSTTLHCGLGDYCYNTLTIDHRSRFFDACKNLKAKHRDSNVRRALAITLLKTYASINALKVGRALQGKEYEWDETMAGELASSMNLITTKTPKEIGELLLSLGFLQDRFIDSTILDVIYDDREDVIDNNNKLVYLLGKQLEQLFDPLTEYSPENTIDLYRPPSEFSSNDDELVRAICQELLILQENITTQLVRFLKEVVIPTRIKALNGKIDDLSPSRMNQVFPPTIDEVTRINCIFLEALKAALPHGSFEVLKACGTTIPYFYKATMRHESAIKSYSNSLKAFLKEHTELIPDGYSEMLIESIMKTPINLTKVKMILERLINTKVWDEKKPLVDYYYKSAFDTIDSFGKDELKPYNRRVFTPSGKVLTEICENWPSILSHGWMNRKVISVFESKNCATNDEGVIILFSDSVVFITVDNDGKEDHLIGSYKPKVADILMNSLVNENPIKNLPNLKVLTWSELKHLEITTFDKSSIRVIFKTPVPQIFVFEVEDNSKVLSLFNKARILSKSTPFHLFKNEKFGFSFFATAQERKSYERESHRSSIVLLLNIDLSAEILQKYNIFAAMSAKFLESELVEVEALTSSGDSFKHVVNSTDLSSFLSEEISALEIKRMSLDNIELFNAEFAANSALISLVVSSTSPVETEPITHVSNNSKLMNAHQNITPEAPHDGLRKTSTKVTGARKSTSSTTQVLEPKGSSNKLKNRLSQIFKFKKRDTDIETSPAALTKVPQNPSHKAKYSAPPVHTTEVNSLDDESEVTELISIDDWKTFESSMTALFDENMEIESDSQIADSDDYDGPNWFLTRENSSYQCNLAKFSEPQLQPSLFGKDELQRAPHNQYSDQNMKQTENQFPTFNSIDEEFSSPLLKVRVQSSDDVASNTNQEDVFYTPRSFKHDFNTSEKTKALKELEKLDFGSFDVSIESDFSEEIIPQRKMPEEISTEEATDKLNLDGTSSERTLSFKSCLDEIDHLRDAVGPENDFLTSQNTSSLGRDDSFRYLLKVFENSFSLADYDTQPETLKTLPRSFSSLKYLAAYIDNESSIPNDLSKVIEE